MNKKQLELLKGLLSQIKELPHRNSSKLNALNQRTEMLINKIFGKTSTYHNSLKKLYFTPRIAFSGSGPGPYDSAWKSGVQNFINLVNTMIEDLTLSIEENPSLEKLTIKPECLNEDIFIVHGHNEEMKQSVARSIEKIGLNPVILHEKANKGKTIIQKFINNSDVGFAIVLMSADDYGYKKSESHEEAKLRARQNVILELGFFLGKLGPERVVAVFETTEDFEIPSDYSGIIFIPYDPGGRWQFDMVKELKSVGYKVDSNLIL